MLNKDDELRVALCIDVSGQDVTTGQNSCHAAVVLWLAEKLKETNEELKLATAEIERINKAFNWEDPCPHGYRKGDHHWYGCMKVSPFDKPVINPRE